MRYDAQIIYPHPVLRLEGSDYVKSAFFADVTCSPSAEADGPLVVQVGFELQCPAIEALLHQGLAAATVQVKCRQTCLNELVNFDGTGRARIEIPSSQVHGSIEIATVIRASADISGFSSDDLAEDFAGVRFDLRDGDILAFAAPVTFYVDREAFGSMESVINLVLNEQVPDDMWEVDTEQEKLRILVGPKLMRSLAAHRQTERGRAFLGASLYLSAVQEAVQVLKDGGDSLLWQRVFRQQFASLGIDLRHVTSSQAAQLILKHPVITALDKLKDSPDED